MKCVRCHPSMVHQKFYHWEGQFWGWRCIFCGNIIDPLILENRYVSGVSGSPKNGGVKGGDRLDGYTADRIYQVKRNMEPVGYAAGGKPGSPPFLNE